MQRRRNILKIGGAVICTSLAGCQTDNQERTSTPGDPADQQTTSSKPDENVDDPTLQLATSTLTKFDPVSQTNAAMSNYKIFQPLFRYRTGTDAQPLLVDTYTHTNHRLFNFKLKEGVQFHNGDELTADDVVYSWERVAASENSVEPGYLLNSGRFSVKHDTDGEGDYVPGSLAVEKLDTYTVRVELENRFEPTPEMLANTRLGIIPTGILGDISGYDGEVDYSRFTTESPVGTGPFTLSNWSKGDSAEIDRVADYHGKSPELSSIKYTVINNPTTEFQRGANDNLDIFNIPNKKIDSTKLSINDLLSNTRRVGEYGPLSTGLVVNYGDKTGLSTGFYIFNLRRVPKPVRQAVALAVNQNELAADSPLRRPGYHVTPPSAFPGGEQAYIEHAKEEYPYGYGESRLDAAKQRMTEAGYDENSPFELTFTIPNNGEYNSAAKLLQEKLRFANIDLSIQSLDFGSLISKAFDAALDMYALTSGLIWPRADALLRYLHPSSGGLPTYWGKVGEEPSAAAQRAENAWQQFVAGGDGTNVSELFIRIEEANWHDVVEIPTFHPREEKVWQKNVTLELSGPLGGQMHLSTDVKR